MAITTIRISTQTKKKLEKLKIFERESYEDVIERLINIASDEPLSEEEGRLIEESLRDIKEGRVLSLEEAERMWSV
ncbi:MAG: hypothetical protein DRO07_01525 [Candidatus Iainarchaeum archaeon]|uniref:Uncharacterized protein n=1 Tax=Candidatus Iainarchaeum sp. TaxID=3101447 RepID=A0A497JG77_9ARCH|nr:MAG: hypothetical protein DRO07_01525 [Candidatus Diapherotrites archaeon]